MNDEPIVVRNRRLVARNALFDVYLDDISDRENNNAVSEFLSVVPRVSNSDGVTGVGVLPIRGETVLLLKVYRYPLRRWTWEVPRGMLDPGESTAQAAVRELHEETGYEIDVKDVREVGAVAPEGGIIDGRVMLYRAYLGEEPPRGRISELGHADAEFFSMEELRSMIKDGAVQDGVSLVLLLGFLCGHPDMQDAFVQSKATNGEKKTKG